VLELHTAFETLSVFTHLGRDIGYIWTGYLRFDHERHSVFFQKTADGILIMRVLHHRQQHADHLSRAGVGPNRRGLINRGPLAQRA